jgi:tellurite resistance protein TerC
MLASVEAWIGFNLFVIFMLVLDIVVFHRKMHEVKVKEALAWSIFWILLALAFNGLIWMRQGEVVALQFLTGYLLEKSLSVDNILVFILIFSYFKIPARYQHRVLFFGILGAIMMRTVFIYCGIALIHRFHWMVYILGFVLLISGVRLFTEKDKEVHPEKSLLVRFFSRIIPTTHTLEGERFFIKQQGRWFATPLFTVLLVVEATDLLFAMDSIPAILAISTDPFIVYSSNIFAILGLRALYFALAGVMQLFRYLHYGLGAILIFVGFKIMTSPWFKIPVWQALSVICVILVVSIAASIAIPEQRKIEVEE